MDLLPPETLVEILQKVPRVGQYIAIMVSKRWREVLETYVIRVQRNKLGGLLKCADVLGGYYKYHITRTTGPCPDDYIKYMYSSYSSIELINWVRELIPDKLSIQWCRNYAIIAARVDANVDIMAAMNRLHAIEFTLDELYKIDEVNAGEYYSYAHDQGPINFAKLLRHGGLKVDWWALVNGILRKKWLSFRFRSTVNSHTHDNQRIQLILAKIILETKWSGDRMFLEMARRNMNTDLMSHLLHVYGGEFKLSKHAMVELFNYPEHFSCATLLEILPPFSAEFIIAKSSDFNALSRAAEALMVASNGHPRAWAGLCAVICRNDALSFRYFNENRAAVRECIKPAIDYARANNMRDILKSLSGYKNSRFSQLYDFSIMRVSDKRKIFNQTKKRVA